MKTLFVVQEGDVWLSTSSMINCGVFSSREKAIAAIRSNMDRKYPGIVKNIESNYPDGFNSGDQWVADRVGILITEIKLDEFSEF